jgi:hypothetical protein
VAHRLIRWASRSRFRWRPRAGRRLKLLNELGARALWARVVSVVGEAGWESLTVARVSPRATREAISSRDGVRPRAKPCISRFCRWYG